MFIFPNTFRYRLNKRLFRERIHFVAAVIADRDRGFWCITKKSGAYFEVPMYGTEIAMGKNLKYSVVETHPNKYEVTTSFVS